MALGIYSKDEFTETYNEHSDDGSMSNPVVTTHDPLELSVVQKKIYLRNNDPSVYYTSVTLQYGPTSVTVGNVNGWKFKLSQQDRQPTDMEWAAISSGNTISFGDIGNEDAADIDYYPIWMKVEVPRGTPQGVYTEAYLILDYTAEVPVAD